ncbi:type III-B CRISPR-associated protein Cas10/Cmr2 [Methylomarinum sp. Ch1-1]|uniref:Type III-B CRISPR-associated protein Cas10/Cmr2 n=1 Tax=Methylomarinum roseum TaxID=3067653 RepID=A0AAU7NZQ6_9GAMM|nr:type III-B CRISPR-associated protein Cas10/Cmr2 [Methylomarinum sp. Ch1-1]MDP4521427.1 type III-B CRISPR-associated protein Cas10/Cmr2 [Methylomarinum sp. Ch1-1]
MTAQYFHFTLGPVQGFVAQARRTRDFWAGSFLLSWLSAVAMQAVQKQGGEIIFPKVSDSYLDWLEQKGKGTPPQQGCVPNRFKGGLAKVPTDFKPELVTNSIQKAWEALANLVWQRDLADAPSITREIWDRQIKSFWEISWALSDNEIESNLLDRRKNWRTYLPPAEAGVKCMMMDGWQELSGIDTPNAKGLKLFWDQLRQTGKHGMKTDLRDSEYLCAIAFIKRRFARYFEELVEPMPVDWMLHGWKVNSAVPSVAYMAAAPWLAQMIRYAPENKLQFFHDAAKKLTQSYGEYDTQLDCIDSVLMQRKDSKLFWNTKSLDGNVFFESALDNKNIYEDREQARKVKEALSDLRRSVNEQNLEPVSPFYAVLMMDGDSLGSHMSDPDKQQNISKGLEKFTNGVQAIVDEYSGFLIYAGGDDVLALLPLEWALNCAKALREHYLKCFAAWDDIDTTLSGAIEYAHIRMPLGKVLSDAHHLLDDIAKEQTGRDAIAVRVWKPGGQHLQWAMPWEKALCSSTGEVIIDQLASDFRRDQQNTPFSNSFFFNVEERFASLQNKDQQREMQLSQEFDQTAMRQLIAAEYLNSGVNLVKDSEKRINLQQAITRIDNLLSQCFPFKRILKNDKPYFESTHQLNPSALQLIRFLAQKGVERG